MGGKKRGEERREEGEDVRDVVAWDGKEAGVKTIITSK